MVVSWSCRHVLDGVAGRPRAAPGGSLVLPREDHPELVLRELARVAEDEVRGDASARALELTLAARDLPDDGSVAQLTSTDTRLGGIRNTLTAHGSRALATANINPTDACVAYAPNPNLKDESSGQKT